MVKLNVWNMILWNRTHTKTVLVEDKAGVRKFSPKRFLNEDEIVWDIMSRMTPELDTEIRAPQNEAAVAVMFHSSFGRYVRNTYGMWHPNNPHTTRAVVDKDNESVYTGNHPDDMSARIIERVYSYSINGM